jgi:aminopeptidase
MVDPRVAKAAEILVNYSARVKKGDYVQILAEPAAEDLALEVYRLILKKGAYPAMRLSLPGQSYIYYKNASDEQLKKFPDIAFYEIKKTNAVIYIGAPSNTKELSNIDPKKISVRQSVLKKLSDYRVEKTNWILFDYPTDAYAQDAEMSLEEFRDFVYRATNVDWEKESKKQDRLKAILDKGKNVRILGKETDIRFSIAGKKSVKCDGKHNMPDGEVYTEPVKNSVNGHIYYEFPAVHGGREVCGVRLVFKDGKVVKATAEKNQDFLINMLDTDAGSRYVGEFGIGVNYNIDRFIKNTLFDEKIGGTIHLALGRAYKDTGGENNSAIHWDMIKDLRNGGEVYIDGKLIEKDGKFTFKL